MDPFSNFFQTVGQGAQQVGNAIGGAVQQGASDLGTVLQNAKNTIKKIGDTAAQQASAEPDPAKKAQLHSIASDAYGTIAPDLGGSPTANSSATMAPPQTTPSKNAITLPSGKIDVPQGPMTQTPTANTSAQATPQTTMPIEERSNAGGPAFVQSPAGQAINQGVQMGQNLMSAEGQNITNVIKNPESSPMAQTMVMKPGETISEYNKQSLPYTMGMVNPEGEKGIMNDKPIGQFLDAKENPLFTKTPDEPVGTSIQFNKDGTETIVPPNQRTNATQYSQEVPAPEAGSGTTPQLHSYPEGGPEFASNEDPMNPRIPSVSPQSQFEKAPLPGGNTADVPKSAVKMFAEKYTVPNKTGAGEWRAMRTIRGMLAHIKGGMDVTQIEPLADQAIQKVSQMTREVIGNIKGDVNPGDPVGAAKQLLDGHQSLVSKENADAVLSDIEAGRPKTNDASSMFTWVQDLEKRASMLRQSSTALTARSDKEMMAKAFTTASREVMENIDKKGGGMLTDMAKTPERLAELDAISPRLGQEVRNADNPSHLRSSIADFVPFSKIAENTDTSGLSTFGHVGTGMRAAYPVNPEDMIQWATNPHGSALKFGIGKAANMFKRSDVDMLKNELSKRPEDAPGSAFRGKSGPQFKDGKPVTGMGKGKKALGIGAALLTAGGIGYVADHLLGQPSNAESNSQGNGEQNSHGDTIVYAGQNVKSLPATIDKVPTDNDGLYAFVAPWQTVGTDNKSAAMTYSQWQALRKPLVTSYNDMKVNDPSQASDIYGQIENLDSTYNAKANQDLQTGWTKAAQIDAKIRDAYNLSENASPSFWQQLPLVGSMDSQKKEAFDNQYHQLLQDLNYIQQNSPYGQGITNIGDKSVMQSTLQQVNKNMWGDYLVGLQQYSGSGAPNGNGTVTPVSNASEANATPNSGSPLAPSGSGFNMGMGAHDNIQFANGQPAITP